MAVAGAATIAVGRGVADGGQDLRPAQYAAVVELRDGEAGPPEAVVARAVARLSLPRIRGAVLGAPPSLEGMSQAPVLRVTVEAESRGADALRARWEADLLGGVVNDDLRDAGFAGVSSVRTTLALPGRDLVDLGGGIGNMVSGQRFADEPPAAVTRTIRTGASRLGLDVESLRFVRGRQLAVALVVTTDDPEATVGALERPSTWETLLGDWRSYEGWMIEIRDRSGAPVVISYVANRAGVASNWTREEFRSGHGESG